MGISVVINTYNAERHLRECLEAVRGFDEVVVCDMESTDGTLEIAREYGCKIVTFPKGNHKSAEPARTFAIQSASEEWVLVVDSDEIVTDGLREYLYKHIDKEGAADGLYIVRLNKVFGAYAKDWAHDYQLRFFRRENTTWPPYVHTFPIVEGRVEKAPTDIKLLHLADATLEEWVLKMNEYTSGEVEKKSEKGYGLIALYVRPRWRFFKNFVLGGGFRNGKRGLLQAMQWAMYQQVLVMKIIEARLRKGEK
ncbi:MAG: glycosyltransferase family 2 protein [Bacteroidales bacterium]|nr:glycosyltransferase family 2 protein [Bacteroidales bacterium]